jgi:hypothetical protein
MENIVAQLNVPNLDQEHFLKYLDFMIFEEPLPENYEVKDNYKELYKEVESIWIDLFQRNLNKQ